MLPIKQRKPTQLVFALSCLRLSYPKVAQAFLQIPLPSSSKISSPLRRPLTTGIGPAAFSVSKVASLSSSEYDYESKIDHLNSQSKALQNFSLQDRLELAEELIARMSCIMKGHNKDKGGYDWLDHDLAVLNLIPKESESSIAPNSSKFPKAVKSAAALNEFLTAYMVSMMLRGTRKRLKYEIAKESGNKGGLFGPRVPPLLRRFRRQVVNGREMNIHGPVEIFPFFQKFEIWAPADSSLGTLDSSNEDDNNDDEGDGSGINFVLLGGNQSFFAFVDTIDCLFSPPYRPVLVKHHSLRPHLFTVYSELFEPLIRRGFAHQVLDNGIPHTQAILRNFNVKHVRMTGGLAGALAVEEFLAESRPHLSKRKIQDMFTSELGCVTPWIFSPGHYSKSELKNAARYITSAKKFLAGCNCLNAQAVVLPSRWKQKDEFKEILFNEFKKTSTDPLYYPGSLDKVQDIINHYGGIESDRVTQISGPIVERVAGNYQAEFLQPSIIECGTFGEEDYDDYALLNEAFGPILAIVEIPSGTDEENGEYLLDHAVPFLNSKDNICGSLSCSLLYPKGQENDFVIEKATGALNYGCVAHNTWSFYGFTGICQGSIWGGSKFEPLGQSGRGLIGNQCQIDHAEKVVVKSRGLGFPVLLQKNFLERVPASIVHFTSAAFLATSPLKFLGNMLRSFRK